MGKIFQGIIRYFNKGQERSKLAKKNIITSFLIKGLNISLGLLLVPLTLNYLDPTRYGIWITISSIVGWMGFFDIGLGNGLRNKLAEAIAQDKEELGKVYVSTTYAILSIIIVAVLVLFIVINPILNWNLLLNVDTSIVRLEELSLLALIVFTFFCLQFVLKLITTILRADQRPAYASVFDLFARILSLIIIFILIKTTISNLVYLGIALSCTPVLVLLIASLWLFSKKYKKFRPSLKYIDFSKARGLLTLGINFFIIHIAVILLYQTNNIVISQLFGAEQVTPYNIAFKYFSVLVMLFSIVLTPFWSAFTNAWVKKDFKWIKRVINKLLLLWGGLSVLGVVMLIFSDSIYDMWIGNKIHISFSMSTLVFIWVLINAWNSIFSQFLNGVGKVKIQMYVGFLAAILNVPLAIFLGKKLGVEGVLLANILVLIIGLFIYPIQYSKIIANKAKGIWDK